jgi:type VI secretion system protein ImpG
VSFNQYYQSELNALRQLGGVFAERNPALAHFLGQGGRDPDVERLLEGFAFLTGRLREKLDDDLPELTHSLMYLLWPNYMRPLPSFSMVQFQPLTQVGPAVIAARDTQIESEPVDGVICKFRTCYATEIQALKLATLNYSEAGEGAILTLRLEVTGDGHLGGLELSRLRLHFSDDPYISKTLYLSLLRHLESVDLLLLGTDKEYEKPAAVSLTLPPDCVQPVGFAEDEALIPYPLNTFRGYRYLQEYFAFHEKFLFVDVSGLEVLHSLPEDTLKHSSGIELRFNITKNGMERQRPTIKNVLLYCTPIVNLFTSDASPIRFDGKQDHYMLLPDEEKRGHRSVFSVDKVGTSEADGQREVFVPFESFEHDASFDAGQARPHYSVRQRSSLSHEGLDTFLSFGAQNIDLSQTVSVDLTCTNQNLPRRLKVGDIHNTKTTLETLIFKNIQVPTASYAPPLNRDFLWKLISNMSLNYVSLANVNALKVILETYDLPRYYDQKSLQVSKTLLDGLKSISHQHVDRLHRGLPVRGLRTELLIDPKGYVGEGDLFLFASILNEFFALYASLNSYHELHVKSTQGEVYQWMPRMGLQPLL